MSRLAGSQPATTTVRLTDTQATSSEFDSAELRAAIDDLCRVAEESGRPIRRREARRMVLERARKRASDQRMLWAARNGLGVKDPTGETAARNLKREGYVEALRARQRQTGGAA